jgi:hypothetical protein
MEYQFRAIAPRAFPLGPAERTRADIGRLQSVRVRDIMCGSKDQRPGVVAQTRRYM